MSLPERAKARNLNRGSLIPTNGIALNHSALLLDVLGYKPWEYTSVCCRTNGSFSAQVLKVTDVWKYVDKLPRGDVWFGVCPVAGPARVGSKGKAEEVTRLAALWADLDVKPGACPDMGVARAIIRDLSTVLGTRPSATTHSGHGLQPYWEIIDGEGDTEALNAVLSRWGRLVKAVAGRHGSTADSVFNLDRIMRVPGTFNCKTATNGSDGIAVACFADDGDPLTLDEVRERLDAAGAYDENGDRDNSEIVSDPNEWEPAEETCGYLKKWLVGISTDRPNAGRHQWLMSQAVRLACAVRLGCLSASDYSTARNLVEQRLIQLRAETGEGVPEVEVPAAFEYGIELAACKTDEQVRAELGDHKHAEQIDEEAFWNSCPELQDMRRFARSRRVGPWAMFGVCAAVAVSAVPPYVVLPPLVGRVASLNTFVALVGKSGSIKSAAMGAAFDWLGVDPPPNPKKPGSGEGLAKCFAYVKKPGKGEPSVQIGKNWSVLAQIPEVDTLTATGGRGGSTLMSELRYAWSGERLGIDYAADDKAIVLQSHRYRLCMIVGVQPLRAGPVFDDADAGTPQRIVWFPVSDPDRPKERPSEPPRLDLPPWPQTDTDAHDTEGEVEGVLRLDRDITLASRMSEPADPESFDVIAVPEAVYTAIDEQAFAVLGDQEDIDPLDGHKLLCREKLAAAIAILRQHREITQQDWDLAGTAMKISDLTRADVLRTLATETGERNIKAGKASGVRKLAEAEQIADEHVKKVARIAERVVEKLNTKNDQTLNELKKQFGPDKQYVDEALNDLEEDGTVTRQEINYRGRDGWRIHLNES